MQGCSHLVVKLELVIVPTSLTCCFFFNDPDPSAIYTLSLHDALPICTPDNRRFTSAELRLLLALGHQIGMAVENRSEEHTSELQSHSDLVCRLLLEKKK